MGSAARAIKIFQESLGPEYKSAPEIAIDLVRYGSCLKLSPGEYFTYGFHARKTSRPQILSYLTSADHFTAHLPTVNGKKSDILQNKLLFKSKITKFGIHVPETIGYTGPTPISELPFEYITPSSICGLLSSRGISRFIVKPSKGAQGKGVHAVSYFPESIKPFIINSLSLSTGDFFKMLAKSSGKLDQQYILFEELVSGSGDFKNISADCAPSIRVVTLKEPNGKIHVTAASIRLGRKGSVTSNESTGGLVGEVKVEKGVITACKTSSSMDGIFIQLHPDTCSPIAGVQIPYWDEVVALCIRAAAVIPNINSVGWDVLVNNGRPVILEGNSRWGITTEQIFGSGYLSPKTRQILSLYGLRFPDRELPRPFVRNIRTAMFGISHPTIQNKSRHPG
ncbi:Sugar-transfer associated ATP-grasp [Marinobacter segnicrescens]|uniref:Sugar-transfer associated ATP-grasp n=1 Tax=Marinobacter segnicrescens TaxID=430453 RepID=A0A1I0H3I1_9GAMM|nr:sugar-transfer associated ATP-grasp domain-containing protein [Marinobacter segnicrescens]SET77386.1 Sugar-transfer associated ATP-grasp [Marinobacter segnicrescens]